MTDITALPIIDENENENSELVSKILDDLNDNPQQEEYESMAPIDNMEQLSELNNEDLNYDNDNMNEYNENGDDEIDYEEDEEDNIYSDDYKLEGGGDDLMSKIKIPIIIAVISLLVNNVKVDEMLLGLSYFNSDGSVNLLGLILKALMVGGIFYLVNTYVLK